MNGWAYYQTKTLAVVPYMVGSPVYLDNTLPHLYAKTKEEGKLPLVFHEDGFNLEKFIVFFERRKTMQVLCKVEEDKRLIPVGFAWVDTPTGVDGARGVICGFCFFREAKGISRDLGRLGLAYWFEDMLIDVVTGIILEHNIPALNYAKKLGFKQVAYVPKWRYVDEKLTGVHVVQIEKNDFMPGFWDWFREQKAAEAQNPVETVTA